MDEQKPAEDEDKKASRIPEPPPAEKERVADGDAIAEVGDAVGGPA